MNEVAAALTATAFGTTSYLELVWVPMVLVCLYFTADVLLDAWRDIPVADDEVDAWITGGTVRSETVNVVGQAIFLLVGVLAALTPPRPDAPTDPMAALASAALPILIMVYQALRTWDARQRRRDRRRISAALRRERLEALVAAGVPVVPGGRREYEQHLAPPVPADADPSTHQGGG